MVNGTKGKIMGKTDGIHSCQEISTHDSGALSKQTVENGVAASNNSTSSSIIVTSINYETIWLADNVATKRSFNLAP